MAFIVLDLVRIMTLDGVLILGIDIGVAVGLGVASVVNWVSMRPHLFLYHSCFFWNLPTS